MSIGDGGGQNNVHRHQGLRRGAGDPTGVVSGVGIRGSKRVVAHGSTRRSGVRSLQRAVDLLCEALSNLAGGHVNGRVRDAGEKRLYDPNRCERRTERTAKSPERAVKGESDRNGRENDSNDSENRRNESQNDRKDITNGNPVHNTISYRVSRAHALHPFVSIRFSALLFRRTSYHVCPHSPTKLRTPNR